MNYQTATEGRPDSAPPATKPVGPDLSELRHEPHSYVYNAEASVVNSWCPGAIPHEECPIRQERIRAWRQRVKSTPATPQTNRTRTFGFSAPDEMLRHSKHEYARPQTYGEPITMACGGDIWNGDCPIVQQLDRVYCAGRNSVRSIEVSIESTEDEPSTMTAEAGGPNPDYDPSMDPINGVSSFAFLEDDLVRWWKETAASDIEGSIEKVREYGGLDLLMLGMAMYQWAKCPCKNWSDNPTEAFLQELGIYFYTMGKLGRSFSALAAGRMPSNDTVLDLDYYPAMIRRIRAVGGWPGRP